MLLASIIVLAASCGQPEPAAPEPRLLLPPYVYAVEGRDLVLYRDNLVLSWRDDGAPYELSFSGLSGELSASAWTHSPSVGEYAFDVSVRVGGLVLDSGSTVVRVSDGEIAPTKVVVVGDSLTAGGLFVPALSALTDGAVTFLGTQGTAPNNHEGVAGKSYAWFEADNNSPMTSATSTLDIGAYLTAIGDTPDVVIWFLGVNDFYAISTIPLADTRADQVLASLTNLLSAWQAEAPTVVHAVCLVTPGSKRDSDYDANYDPPTPNSEWTWRRKQHRANERFISDWVGDGSDVWLVPINLGLDRVDGYPVGNALHPDASGHAQIAEAVHAWLAWVR